jgi:excisionase family DNA binding protein
MEDELLSVSEVAAYLGVSRPTVYRLMRTGELEYSLVGTRRRVSRVALDAMLARTLQAVQDAAKEEA